MMCPCVFRCVTLTDATLCGYSLGFSNCIKGLSSLVQQRGMGCIVAQLTYKVLFAIYQYVGANAFNCYILCKHLSLLALGLGFAVARAHPRGLLRPRK